MATYKTDDNIYKDGLHFRCKVGCDEFLDIWWTDELELEVGFICMPNNFWNRLRWLFSKEYFSKSIMLTKNDTKELEKYLYKVLNK